MGRLIYLLNAIRVVQLIGGAGALGCHIANILLLQTFASQTAGVGSWWDARYLPYIFYFAADGFSVLCSIMLLIGACARTKSVQADKSLSLINAIVLAAAGIYATLKSQEPWTNGRVILQIEPLGWNQYCYFFKADQPNLYFRCWLINGVWLGTFFTCLTWLIGGILVWSRQRSDFFSEYHENDYNSDIPPLPPVSTAGTTTTAGYDNGSPRISPSATPAPYKSYNTTPAPPAPPPGRNNFTTPYAGTPYAQSRTSYGDERRFNTTPAVTPGTDNGSKYPSEDSDTYYTSVSGRTATSNPTYNTNAAAGYGGYNNNQGYNNTAYTQPTYSNSRNAGGGGGYNAYNNSSSGAGYSATPQGYSANNNHSGRTGYN